LFQAVQKFTCLADDSDEVPKLSNGRQYSNFKLSNAEWKQLELVHEVLQVRVCSIGMVLPRPYVLSPIMEQEITGTQHNFSSDTESTVTRAISILEWLQTRWEQMTRLDRYRSLAPAIKAGLTSLCKCYKDLDLSDAYVICHSTLSLPFGDRNTV
jgi:hypothetical protein